MKGEPQLYFNVTPLWEDAINFLSQISNRLKEVGEEASCETGSKESYKGSVEN